MKSKLCNDEERDAKNRDGSVKDPEEAKSFHSSSFRLKIWGCPGKLG